MPSPAPKAQQEVQEIPLAMVGGNKFGRFPKISDEQTYNFIVSDGFLVPYAGYKAAIEVNPTQVGRGLYMSSPGNIMVAVIGANVYSIGPSLVPILRGTLETSNTEVYIAENNNKQICLTDGAFVYVYDWSDQSFVSNSPNNPGVTFPFTDGNPGYIAFQNTYLIIALGNTQQWVLSAQNQALTWSSSAAFVGEIQSKPGFIQAAVPTPGGGNNILIMGDNVCESWQFTGAALFPYQRNSTYSIDYGCLNPASIAELDNFIVWLAVNEQSGPVIMYSQGNQTKNVSTDGIDFKLAQLSDPGNCTGFLFRQDGHLIYQFTFVTDNLSYAYDFNSGLFFTVTDENWDYHIARQVVFFENDYYFVSLDGGNVYRFGTQYTDAIYSVEDDADSREIPRLRVPPPLRMPSQRYFIIKSVGFTIENGQPNHITTVSYQPGATGIDIATESLDDLLTEGGLFITTEADSSAPVTYEIRSEAVDLSISRDGGESFGSSWRLEMNKVGKRKSRFIWQRCGIANDSTLQFRFSGFGRFVCTDGIVEIYQ